MKYKHLYFLFSLLFVVPGTISLITYGFKPSIDFTGGSILEISLTLLEKYGPDKQSTSSAQPQSTDPQSLITATLKEKEIDLSSIQKSSQDSYIVRTGTIDKNQKDELIQSLESQSYQVEETRFETVGPTIGKELITKTVTAILLAAGFIMFYVATRFKDKKYGVCAIIAMFHDTLILLGVFSILGHFFNVEVDTLFVTAVLTILSFSVHDTIVVYDRIRESIKHFPSNSYESIVNKAVAETLTRSINNSMTIIFMLLCLYLLGGQTIKWFVFALLIGTISGTYSSTFTAAPLLIVWDNIQNSDKLKNYLAKLKLKK